jgi:DNA-binding response OmpR family regulator
MISIRGRVGLVRRIDEETQMAIWNVDSLGDDWTGDDDTEEQSLSDLPDVRPARLLLAEDDDELRHCIAHELRRKGYEVDEAFSGFEAIALISRHSDPYDLIISDLQLHGISGLEIVDELRGSTRREDADIPVILLGEGASGETRSEAQRLHAVLVEKPCDLEELWLQAEKLARPVQLETRLD